MMMSFCLISAVMQTFHGWVLHRNNRFPRIIHYIEYAYSSPLMVMVMAVNVGIREVFTITCLAGLFYGMNMLGMCAEAMAHYARHIPKPDLFTYTAICKGIHLAGWFLFFGAMIPIWAQFHQVLRCSENGGTPTYAYAAVVLESLLFFVFGFIQIASLFEKLTLVWKSDDETKTDTKLTIILFRYDCMHATTSVLAKTMLVYLLLAPALSVDPDKLT
jgi:hypothetical protein